ncbi:MAG: HD domain-containing protein [Nitrososphaerota archaeon]
MPLKLIKDPVHGYIEVSGEELQVIDTRAVQRLRRISQLPFVYLVYPGARHSRFDHSLGCMHLAGEFARSLGLDEYKVRVLRIAGLIHDVGHTPYSHLFEAILERAGSNHETMTARVLEEDPELGDAVEKCGIALKDVISVVEGRVPESTVISGPIDADKLDFLVRDSYFTGAPYGLIDVRRIVLRSRLVDGKLAININAVGAVEEMALARYQNFMNIYLHHTARAAQMLFLSGAKLLEEISGLPSMSVEEYLSHDDYTIWCLMKSNDKTRWIIDRIERRIIPKVAYELRLREEEVPAEILRSPEQVIGEISSLSGVPEDRIWLDTPYITPLPFRDSERIAFYEERYGELRPVEYSSPLLEFTSRMYIVIRVYADLPFLERVKNASEKYFGEKL